MKESVRARMRVMVKRILRKYGYPPDKQEKAVETVLEHATVLCGEWAAGSVTRTTKSHADKRTRWWLLVGFRVFNYIQPERAYQMTVNEHFNEAIDQWVRQHCHHRLRRYSENCTTVVEREKCLADYTSFHRIH